MCQYFSYPFIFLKTDTCLFSDNRRYYRLFNDTTRQIMLAQTASCRHKRGERLQSDVPGVDGVIKYAVRENARVYGNGETY